MHRTELCLLIIACGVTCAAQGAWAQTAPPIKPGLWQIHTEREKDGQKSPDVTERMKNMTPEARKRVEEMMKQQGVAPGTAGMTKLCYSRETLEHGDWADQQGGCTTNFSNRSATSWKWHSSCPQFGYQGDGEATFSDSESFVVRSTGVSTGGGQTHTSSSTRTGKWLAADCGDLKPPNPKP